MQVVVGGRDLTVGAIQSKLLTNKGQRLFYPSNQSCIRNMPAWPVIDKPI